MLMKDFFQWVGAYPLWLRIVFYLLLPTCIELLIAFGGRGEAPPIPKQVAHPVENGTPSSSTAKNQPESKRGEELATQVVDPSTRQPLSVTFADGERGIVEVSVRLQLPPNKAPRLVANFGSFAESQKQLMTFLEGQIRAEFAKHTITQAQLKRDTISANLLAVAKKAAEQNFGFIVHDITLGDIRPVK